MQRALEKKEKAAERRKKDAENHRIARAKESQSQRQSRRDRDNAWHRAYRAAETEERKQERHRREAQSRKKKVLNLQNAGFDYEANTDLSKFKDLLIGPMDKVCQHCNAKKWKKETDGLCCGNGKIQPPEIQAPQPLKDLVKGDTPESKSFLKNTGKPQNFLILFLLLA